MEEVKVSQSLEPWIPADEWRDAMERSSLSVGMTSKEEEKRLMTSGKYRVEEPVEKLTLKWMEGDWNRSGVELSERETGLREPIGVSPSLS